MTRSLLTNQPRCDVCHQLIMNVLYRTLALRLPYHLPVGAEDSPWELFVAWSACRACAQSFQAMPYRDLVMRAHMFRQSSVAEKTKFFDTYRYQFSHFTVPVVHEVLVTN